MNTIRLGPAHLIRPSTDIEAFVRNEAQEHLRSHFPIGTFNKAEDINAIIHHQFTFYDSQLRRLVARIASRDAAQCVLFQYDQATQILHNENLDEQEAKEWSRLEGTFRRAVKYIMELMCMERPHGVPKVAKSLAAVSIVRSIAGETQSFLLLHPEYVIYPIQTLICAGLMIFYWRYYTWRPFRGLGWGALGGGVVLVIWLTPQLFLGFPPRLEGFDPTRINSEAGYQFTVAMRLLRLVIIVPLLEEIFWRGFLMRYLSREDWQGLAFGECSRKAFFITAACFALVHQWADMPAAFVTGLIYNQIAVYTRSLTACVVAHAITNLGLGWYIMVTKQWGFW